MLLATQNTAGNCVRLWRGPGAVWVVALSNSGAACEHLTHGTSEKKAEDHRTTYHKTQSMGLDTKGTGRTRTRGLVVCGPVVLSFNSQNVRPGLAELGLSAALVYCELLVSRPQE